MLFKLIIYEDKYMNTVKEVTSFEKPSELVEYIENFTNEATQFIGVDIAHGKDKTAAVVMEMCSFDGCDGFVCEADKESPDRMHFCQKHHDQLAQYVEENAIPKIVGFWVKANGGAKKLARTF